MCLTLPEQRRPVSATAELAGPATPLTLEGVSVGQRKKPKLSLVAQKDLFETLQAGLTVAAIVIGGWWTYRLFVEHRESKAHLNISHALVIKAISPNLLWIHLTVTAENRGDSLATLHSADVRLQQILPLDPSLDEERRNNNLVPAGQTQVPWPTLKRSVLPLDDEIEPKESDNIEFDFTIPSSVKTVRVYTYFENAENSSTRKRMGWSRGTVYDLSGEKKDDSPQNDSPD